MTDVTPRSSVPSLVCAFMASLTTGGTTYGFSVYSEELKSSLNLTQGQLETLSTSFFLAGLLSWAPGMCVDRFGTRRSLALGGFLGALSLLSYWSVATRIVPVHQTMIVPVLSLLGICIFMSNSLTTGSVFKIIVVSCGPGSKGAAVGAAKGFVGLGSGAYACLFASLNQKNGSDLNFLPMAAFFAIMCATLPALLVLPSCEDLQNERMMDNSTNAHYRLLYCSLVGMAIIVTVNSMYELYEEGKESPGMPVPHPPAPMALLLITMWLGPIVLLNFLPRKNYDDIGIEATRISPTDEENEAFVDEDEPCANQDDYALAQQENRLSCGDEESDKEDAQSEREVGNEEEVLLANSDAIVGPREYRLTDMLRTPTALFMLWTTTILVGAGTVETNNMGQMVESLGFPKGVNSASVALFSVAQSGGRVFTGSVSEAALKWPMFGCRSGTPRPAFLVGASAIGFCAHFLLSSATGEADFVVGAILSGVAFGMVWPLMVLIIGEVFGTENVGANYMFFDGFTSAVGTLILSKVVAEAVYEDNIGPASPDPNTCIGAKCFFATHLTVSILSLTCIVTSLVTLRNTRSLYESNSASTSAERGSEIE